MWKHSPKIDIYSALPPPEVFGWKRGSTGNYKIDWDCSDFQINVQETINFLTKGCTCKKGCKTKQCLCKKNGRNCGPGCHCQGCTNVRFVIVTSRNNVAPTVCQEELSADEGSETESDSDTCSTCSTTNERYDTEIITDSDYLLDEASNIVHSLATPVCQNKFTMHACICTVMYQKNGILLSPPYIHLNTFTD